MKRKLMSLILLTALLAVLGTGCAPPHMAAPPAPPAPPGAPAH